MQSNIKSEKEYNEETTKENTFITHGINTHKIIGIRGSSDVEVVEEMIRNLFGKSTSRREAGILVELAGEREMYLRDMIENTYEYHTKIEPCISIFGSIRYALRIGGWKIAREKTYGYPSHQGDYYCTYA